jgi:hypothetical protein
MKQEVYIVKRRPWSGPIWPVIIILSTIATGLITFVIPDSAARPFIVFWFLCVCPGMALVGFFQLEELVVEWVFSLTLSFSLDAAIAGILLYARSWSPTGILVILMSISLCGAIIQIGFSRKFHFKRRRFS